MARLYTFNEDIKRIYKYHNTKESKDKVTKTARELLMKEHNIVPDQWVELRTVDQEYFLYETLYNKFKELEYDNLNWSNADESKHEWENNIYKIGNDYIEDYNHWIDLLFTRFYNEDEDQLDTSEKTHQNIKDKYKEFLKVFRHFCPGDIEPNEKQFKESSRVYDYVMTKKTSIDLYLYDDDFGEFDYPFLNADMDVYMGARHIYHNYEDLREDIINFALGKYKLKIDFEGLEKSYKVVREMESTLEHYEYLTEQPNEKEKDYNIKLERYRYDCFYGYHKTKLEDLNNFIIKTN